MGHEIELKLSLDEAALTRVPQIAPFDAVDFTTKPPKKLKAIYFDTDTNSLRKNGLVLRLRDEDGRMVQTLKSKKLFGSLAAGRAEYENTVRKNRKSPDISQLPADIQEDLTKVLNGDRLEPLFNTDVERTIGMLDTGRGDMIELALDRGVIRSGARETPVSEMELELKKGDPACLYKVALGLVGAVPVRIGMRSKGERGYALANDLTPKPVKVETVRLGKSATVAETLEQVLRHCLSHIVANEPALVDMGDPEALHQMRVALRRLRAALEIFAPVLDLEMSRDLTAKAKELAAVLGHARDMDVFRSELIAPLKETGSDDIAALDLEAAAAQTKAWEQALEAVRLPAFTHTCLSLALYIEERSWHSAAAGDAAKEMRLAMPARQFAAQALGKRLKKTKALARDMAHLSLDERHEMRKQLKRLRYGVGFFSSLYPKKRVSKQLRRLSRLQDMFGSLNDLAVADEIVTELTKANAASDQIVLIAKGAGRVLGWHGARAEANWSKAMSTWASFQKIPPFWR